jgi:hypothetical protein
VPAVGKLAGAPPRTLPARLPDASDRGLCQDSSARGCTRLEALGPKCGDDVYVPLAHDLLQKWHPVLVLLLEAGSSPGRPPPSARGFSMEVTIRGFL